MTQPSPQPAEDLERVLVEIDAQLSLLEPGSNRRISLTQEQARAIRAALVRERELREALREITEMWSAELMRDRAKEALLAQPAAGEAKRG